MFVEIPAGSTTAGRGFAHTFKFGARPHVAPGVPSSQSIEPTEDSTVIPLRSIPG